jgi:DNA-directed RNA polymerase specialized sigma24 family protein
VRTMPFPIRTEEAPTPGASVAATGSATRSSGVVMFTRPPTHLASTSPNPCDVGDVPAVGGSARLSSQTSSGNALDQAQAAFTAMMAGPSPLTLNGVDLGHGFPTRGIDLVELRSILLDARTSADSRDAAWAELVGRSRDDDPTWTIGCIGVALPGLKTIAARATKGTTTALAEDIVAEMLTAFLEALATVDVDRRAILSRLNWHARRAANRARHHHSRETALDPERIGPLTSHRHSEGHVDLVLADAVQRGTISAVEAEIIIETRLEGRSCAVVAAAFGLSYEALMKRRRRAETRLAADLTGDCSAGLMSRNGV